MILSSLPGSSVGRTKIFKKGNGGGLLHLVLNLLGLDLGKDANNSVSVARNSKTQSNTYSESRKSV